MTANIKLAALFNVNPDFKHFSKSASDMLFVKDLIEENNFKTKLSADFVVQKSNYKDLPLFANLCREFGLSMNIQKMWNWDTWDKEVFYDMNVYDSKHYLYDDLKEYFKLANLPMAEN